MAIPPNIQSFAQRPLEMVVVIGVIFGEGVNTKRLQLCTSHTTDITKGYSGNPSIGLRFQKPASV